MKARFFYAPYIQHQNGKSTWQKIYVLTDDDILYSEYLDYMRPAKDIKKFNFETFNQTDYRFDNYQSLIEISYEEAKTKTLLKQDNWVDVYINKKNIIIGPYKEKDIILPDTPHDIQESTEISDNELIQDFINNMIYVEGGKFIMGYTKPETLETREDLTPHEVTLNSFQINKFLVTQDLYDRIMGYDDSNYKINKSPILNLSLDNVIDFINELNSITKLKFRLPTEAEWEYAARGGLKSNNYRYAGSESIRKVSFFDENSNGTIQNVGQKMPNELGIYDMSGLAWEICQDGFYSYTAEAQVNPCNNVDSRGKILRGGSYKSNSKTCTVYNRDSDWWRNQHVTSLRLVI